ncbi:pyridoxamine 5'-phosphate oxidase family protein [Pseudonocardia asaccharolytica]|uniref:pyridoxamine 5'-phosphate oxidase family protein n=1 Tax=Pseudonocardia asaccharolytica TaxID=54010 RepID=UPI0011BF873C
MSANGSSTKNLADLYALAPLGWDAVRRRLATNLTQEPGTGGPGHHTCWLSTIDHDGCPHMTAVGASWIDGRYYFCGGPGSARSATSSATPAARSASPSTATTSPRGGVRRDVRGARRRNPLDLLIHSGARAGGHGRAQPPGGSAPTRAPATAPPVRTYS